MVISASKTPEDPADVAGSVVVVTGEQLRRSGARTLQDALQDVVGVESAGGSDGGPRFPNLGMWGLKEFDALLVTVDGVPAGGPFNPSLSQIPIEDIDRIEIVKGPQGTLYGVSAFAGMVQVFTRRGKNSSVTLGLGSWNDRHASLSWEKHDGNATTASAARCSATTASRTGRVLPSTGCRSASDRSRARARGTSRSAILRDTAYWGSPLPVEGGAFVPGFEVDRNYAVGGARMDHRVYSLTSTASQRLSGTVRVENTLGLARDEQIAVRSFIDGVDGSTATANGVVPAPDRDDAVRGRARRDDAREHRIVSGDGVHVGPDDGRRDRLRPHAHDRLDPVVPSVDSLPVGDNRSAEDSRTFWGFYANDTWTPWKWLALTFGARYDRTSEIALGRSCRRTGAPEPEGGSDERTDRQVVRRRVGALPGRGRKGQGLPERPPPLRRPPRATSSPPRRTSSRPRPRRSSSPSARARARRPQGAPLRRQRRPRGVASSTCRSRTSSSRRSGRTARPDTHERGRGALPGLRGPGHVGAAEVGVLLALGRLRPPRRDVRVLLVPDARRRAPRRGRQARRARAARPLEREARRGRRRRASASGAPSATRASARTPAATPTTRPRSTSGTRASPGRTSGCACPSRAATSGRPPRRDGERARRRAVLPRAAAALRRGAHAEVLARLPIPAARGRGAPPRRGGPGGSGREGCARRASWARGRRRTAGARSRGRSRSSRPRASPSASNV